MKRIYAHRHQSLIAILVLVFSGWLQAQPGGWSVNPAQFQYNMTITAQIEVNGVPNHALDNHLAVFCKGQIRGYAKAIGINGQAYYFITAFSNLFQGDTLYFRAFLEAEQKIYESPDILIFKHQKIEGKIANPYKVHLFLGERPLIYSLSDVNYTPGTCPDVVDIQASDNHDQEGNGLIYSIVGGEDADKFSVNTQTGVLSWLNFAPLLNPPGDANGDHKYQVKVKVTDSSGLTDEQNITVTIVPESPVPPLVCPSNLALLTSDDGTGDCGAGTNQAMIYALNPCALSGLTYTLSGATQATGSGQITATRSFQKGITTVTYNNTLTQCSFTVGVTDDELPTITCPADTTVYAANTPPCAAVVQGIDAVFNDNCAGASLSYVFGGASSGSGNGQLSGLVFAVGTTDVLYQVTDAVGQSVGCPFAITVVDSISPVALCKNDTVQLDPQGQAFILPSQIDNGSNDACGIASLSVAPNSFTCTNAGANMVTLTVTDLHNLVSACTATVFVKALSLGNLVFNDLNRNGLYDAGDVGINGVLCNLYHDDGDGVLDLGDGSPIATFTTTNLHGQVGAYVFSLLCPDDYIVEIAPANFNPGGVLYDSIGMSPLVSSPLGGAPDPDNNQNDDDNGEVTSGFGVASSAISLAFDTEPDNDGDTDKNTNLSLDFGFKTPVSVSINDVTMLEGTGGTNTAFNFTVTRTDNLDAFILNVNTLDGTALSSSDYTAISNGTLSFAAGGSLTATVTVLVNHDNSVEHDETFSVTLTNPGGNVNLLDSIGIGTITNDDNAVVTLSGGIAQNEGSTFTFTATLNNAVQGGFSVAFSTENGTANTTDNDYTDNDGALNFVGTAGEIKTITVSTIQDNKVELDETFSVLLGAITGAPAGVSTAGAPQTGTISNDDAAIISIAANISQLEANSPQTFSITLSNPVDVAVSVDFSSSNGTATTADNDYNGIVAQTLTFPMGSTAPQTVGVIIPNDNKVEADEVYQVAIGALNASGRNLSLGASSRTGTLINDDSAVLSLSGGIAQNEGNAGTTAYQFTATLNNPVQGGFTALYSTQDGTATTANNDYIDNDASLTFAGVAGETQTFTVLVNGDLNIEADETFQTTINSLNGIPMPPAVSIAGSPQIATILNDEADWGDAPTAAQSGFANSYPTLLADNGARHGASLGGLRLGSSIDAEINGQPNALASGDGADENGVTLPPALVLNDNAEITVNASASGVLNAWVDYNRDGDWADGGEQILTNQNVVAGDNILSFAVPGNASLGQSFARFRLTTVPGISFNGLAADGEVEDYAVNLVNTRFNVNDPVVTEGNVGTVNLSFIISRTNNSNACSVNYAITGGTATVLNNDYQSFMSGTANFTAGGALSQTINVVVNGDLTVELNETVDLSLSNPVNAGIEDGLGVGTIVNDDAATISITNPSTQEGDINTSAMGTFTIQLSQAADVDLTFSFETLDGTATIANADYVASNGSLVLIAGQVSQTVSITINGDCIIEPTETYQLRLSNLVHQGRNISFAGGGASLTGIGSILNDDALPGITCPANMVRNVDPGVCTTTITLPLPTTTSICGTAILQFRYRLVDNQNNPIGPFNNYAPSGNNTVVLASGTYEVEWRVSDGSGSVDCRFYVQIIDNQPPIITCPPNQIINANANCSGLVGTWNPVSLSDNCTPLGQIAVGQSPNANTPLFGHGNSVVVVLFARDLSNNVSTCSFTVTLRDVTPPVARCKQGKVNLGANGMVTVLPATVNNNSSDNCSFTMSVSPNTFDCSQVGVHIVTLKVTDAGGNMSNCTAKLTVRDNDLPMAKCKKATLFLNDMGTATLTVAQVDNGSTDNCGLASRILSHSDFNCSDISGSNPVTLTLTDIHGNKSSCVSQVNVLDNLAPTAVCDDVTVKLNQGGIAVVFPSTLAANSFDNCSVWSYSPNVKVYNTSNIGLNFLTITVKDFSGNSATCVSEVTVQPFNFWDDSGERSVDAPSEEAISLYPNPTTGAATLAFELPDVQPIHYRVYDLTGRLILHQEAMGVKGANNLPVVLHGVDQGIYLLDFQSENRKVILRLMVKE